MNHATQSTTIMNPHYQIPKSLESSNIASSIISEIFIPRAASLYIPKPTIFQNCKNDVHNMSDSLLALSQVKPDSSPKIIKPIKDLYPNFTKVKKKTGSQSLFRAGSDGVSIKSIFSKDGGTSNSQKNFQVASLKGFQKTKKILPSLSGHRSGTNEMSMFQQVLFLNNQIEQEDIKALRENKISTKTQYISSSEKYSPVKKSEFRKKVKESQLKKQLGLTTDYDGNLLHLGKGELKRKVCHYIEIQAQLFEEKQKREKDFLNNSQYENKKGLEQQFTNYKSLVLTQVDDQFSNSLTKNFNRQECQADKSESKRQSIQNIQQDNEVGDKQKFCDEEMKKKCSDFKLSGKTFKPTSVGFHIFEKMKELNWKIQKPNGQKQNTNPSYQKQLPFPYKEWKRNARYSHNTTQLGSNAKCNKSDVITTVGSVNAMNTLLRNDRKYMKKVVRIDSQFL